MSDLLSRLVDRATGAPSRVEPVLPSLYEPVGAIDPLPVLEQSVTGGREDASVLPGQDGARTVPHAGEPFRFAPKSAEAAKGWLTTAPAEPKPTLSLAIPVAPPVQASEVRVGRPEGQDELDSRPTQGRTHSIANNDKAGAVEPVVSAVSVAPAAKAGGAAESVLPVVQGKRARQSMPAGPTSAPVEVQVTIGHIEVRTAAPPPQVPQRRPSGPTVTLEDYLRRRNGAAR